MNFYKSLKTNSIFDWILLFLLSLFFLNFVNTFEGNTSLENDQELEEFWYWNKEDYPNPYEQPPYCRRTRPSYICDPDQVLSRKEANRLDDWIKSLKNVSHCFCPYCPPNERGLSFAVAIMKNIYRDYNVRRNEEIFAEFLRKKWDFGICDNNVVIILITSDNQVAFSQGSVTLKVYPKFLLEDSILNNKIDFVQERYYQGFEKILKSVSNTLKRNLQYSEPSKEEEKGEDSENDDSSHTGLIVGLIIGFVLFVVFIIFLLIYLKRRFSEDMDSFQFKGMLSKGYWLNKNERLRPVSVNPINTVGGVYEPCSIEETNDTDPDTRLRQKLSQISDETSSDEEDIQVIEHNSQTPSLNENITDISRGQTKKDNQSDVLSNSYTKNDQNV